MKHKIICVLLFFCFSANVIAAVDDTKAAVDDTKAAVDDTKAAVDDTKAAVDDIKDRLDAIEHMIKTIDSNQLNYKVEKDLLKETYSNNYERINLFITIILGVFTILGYLGFRDINAIKERYESQLSKMKRVQAQMISKSNMFEDAKNKIDEELKVIIKENQAQSQKIKFIELKEKMFSLFENENLSLSLEFANAALGIEPSDSTCLNTKARILTQLNQLDEALSAYKKCVDDNPNDESSKLNLIECLYFLGLSDEAKKLIEEYKISFTTDRLEKLPHLFEIFEYYHEANLDKLKEIAQGYVTTENLNSKQRMMTTWNLKEALYFIANQKESDLKKATQAILWYWDDQITGKKLLQTLNLPIPQKEVVEPNAKPPAAQVIKDLKPE